MASLARNPLSFTLGVMLATACVSAIAQTIAVRFYPERGVYAYPVDLRNVQGVLVQNISIANTGSTPVTLELSRLRSKETEPLRSRARWAWQISPGTPGPVRK